MQKKRPILKLNANFFPLETSNWSDVITNIFSDRAHPVDIQYVQNEDGSYDISQIETFTVVKNWDEWSRLPIRVCDDYVHTSRGPIRLPSVVVCTHFSKIVFHTCQFPTKHNIHKRDKYTCGYTGRKLAKGELSVDHIVPISRGGENTWTNLITCSREINSFKNNRLPHECGLKLLWKPVKPSNGLTFDIIRADWEMFIKS